jgi:16S rRNA (guanine(966)-N(2))-methyltransferase RsmD
MLDRMRETLFNVLQQQVPGAVFADLYAGTGSVGIEALSRGASKVIFVESSPAATKIIRRNLESLGSPDNAHIWAMRVANAIPSLNAAIVFLGPPYAADDEFQSTLDALGKNPPSIVIAQRDRKKPLAERYGELERYREMPMGASCFSFYRPRPFHQASSE